MESLVQGENILNTVEKKCDKGSRDEIEKLVLFDFVMAYQA